MKNKQTGEQLCQKGDEHPGVEQFEWFSSVPCSMKGQQHPSLIWDNIITWAQVKGSDYPAALISPHLEYSCLQFWTYCKTNIDKLEQVKQKATKRVAMSLKNPFLAIFWWGTNWPLQLCSVSRAALTCVTNWHLLPWAEGDIQVLLSSHTCPYADR